MNHFNTLIDLSEAYGLLKVSGLDAKKLLQGQLTCDLEKVTPLHGAFGAHCNREGRIISLFYLFFLQDHYYLLMPRSMIQIALAALKKYAVFYKAKLTEASDDLMTIGYINSLPIHLSSTKEIALFSFPTKTLHSAVAFRYLIIGEKEAIKNEWAQLKKQATISPVHTWKYLNIQDGNPMIYPETSEQCLPHEINLDQLNALSFDKGCYTGQEIIARMHYRGKLKKHLYRANITCKTLPKPGTAILENKTFKVCGMLINAVLKESHDYETLISLDENHKKENHLFLNSEILLNGEKANCFTIMG